MSESKRTMVHRINLDHMELIIYVPTNNIRYHLACHACGVTSHDLGTEELMEAIPKSLAYVREKIRIMHEEIEEAAELVAI